MPVIIFNGKNYGSVDEMPPNEREAFEQLSKMFVDRDGNGIPDFMEGDMAKNVVTAYSSSMIHNGKRDNAANELPDEMHSRVMNAFEKLADLGVVTRDLTTSMRTMSAQGSPQRSSLISKPMISREVQPAIQEEQGTSPLIWIALGAGLVLCALAAAIGAYILLK